MVDIHLSLRQRKLLHYIQDQHSYVTGTELANHLQVSARTIRSDVAEINENLQGTGISIISKRSLGYLLKVEDKKLLKELNQVSNTFLTRDDRTRHMAFVFAWLKNPLTSIHWKMKCLSAVPLWSMTWPPCEKNMCFPIPISTTVEAKTTFSLKTTNERDELS